MRKETKEAREHLEQCLLHQSEAAREAARQSLHELEVTTGPLASNSLNLGDSND